MPRGVIRRRLLFAAFPVAWISCVYAVRAQTAPPRFRAVSIGTNHVCALTSTGAAFCWGDNQHGQLGMGVADTLEHEIPQRVTGVPGLRALAAGTNFTCGLTRTGAAYCWGQNDAGQLGIGTADTLAHPSPATVVGGHLFRAIAAGEKHTCGVATTGAAYCWGLNSSGQLGDGAFDIDKATPVPVLGSLTFRAITAGGGHTCAVSTSGAALCWGEDEKGQLGVGHHPQDHYDRPQPVRGRLRFRAIDAGVAYTCGLTEGGAVYCWGKNDHGELGNETDTDPMDDNRSRHPIRAAGDWTFTSVTAGESHTCGMTTPIGVVACWGSNTSGELGGFTQRDDYSPSPVLMEAGLRFTSVAAGPGLSCGVTPLGQVYCWGYGDSEPVRVPPPRSR